MAIVKKSKVQIMNVIDDDEHDLDDEGTRKILSQAKEKEKEVKKEAEQLPN